MAIIKDMIPAFDLFQPTTVDDASALLDEHGSEAWVLAGGLDSYDWFKDRIKRPKVVVDLGAIFTKTPEWIAACVLRRPGGMAGPTRSVHVPCAAAGPHPAVCALLPLRSLLPAGARRTRAASRPCLEQRRTVDTPFAGWRRCVCWATHPRLICRRSR